MLSPLSVALVQMHKARIYDLFVFRLNSCVYVSSIKYFHSNPNCGKCPWIHVLLFNNVIIYSMLCIYQNTAQVSTMQVLGLPVMNDFDY